MYEKIYSFGFSCVSNELFIFAIVFKNVILLSPGIDYIHAFQIYVTCFLNTGLIILRISSLCSFVDLPVASCILASHILLVALFSNTVSLCSSLQESDKVSHPYRTFDILKDKFSKFNGNKAFPNLISS